MVELNQLSNHAIDRPLSNKTERNGADTVTGQWPLHTARAIASPRQHAIGDMRGAAAASGRRRQSSVPDEGPSGLLRRRRWVSGRHCFPRRGQSTARDGNGRAATRRRRKGGVNPIQADLCSFWTARSHGHCVVCRESARSVPAKSDGEDWARARRTVVEPVEIGR